MATITKTIGAAGDYANPAAAATDFNAGTISGASAADDIVFEFIDNAAYNSRFNLTANPTSYASCTLTVNASVRHTGIEGTGARIDITSGTGASEAAVVSSTLAIPFAVEWLEICCSGSGKYDTLLAVRENTTTALVRVQNCIIHDNNSTTTVRCWGVEIGLRKCTFTNNQVYNINQAGAGGSLCYGVSIGRSTPQDQYICNNTIYNITSAATGGCVGMTNGRTIATGNNSFAFQDDASLRLRNNVVINVTGAGGSVQCYQFRTTSYTVATVDRLGSSDSTAVGTGSLTSLTTGEFRDTSSGDLRLASGADCFEAGVDLVTTPSGVEIDIEGRNRDSSADTWSIGSSQTTNAPVNSVTLTSPVSSPIIYQRTGSSATITIAGTYTGTPTEIEYSFAGGAYQTLDASPSGNAFSESVSLAQGQGTLAVRFSNDTDANDTASVAVGDIFFVAGQSNASGRLTSLQSYSHGSLMPLMYISGGWEELTDPTDTETLLGSIWPLIATLHMADQSVPCGFVPAAEGGTSLTVDWKPTPTTGVKYNGAVVHFNAADLNGVKALIWDQGESDAGNSETKANYNAALDALAANLQTDTGLTFPTICDLVGTVSPAGTLDEIRKAQIEAWDDNADIYPGANSITRASLHWESNAEGATFAALLWAAMDEALYSGPSARGPRLSSAVTISGTSTLTLTFDRDLLASDTTYTSTAFTVSHGGTARTVSSVTRTGTRTVQLTLSGALDGSTPTVTFGSGNAAASATVPRTTAISLPATIHSISSISVPAEPIYAAAVTVNAPDTTAPVIAAAAVNSAGTTLTVTFTESDSPPLLPSSAATGITLASTGASVTVSNGTRQSDLVFTFPLSRTVYNNETLLVSYTQASGNITDSAVPSVNEVPNTSNFAVTNSSTQEPTITSVAVDAIVLVGTADTITWSSAGIIGNVDILLSLDNGSTFPITIVSGTANDGSYSWTPEAAQITATGVVRVRSSTQTSIYDDQTVIVATTSGGVGGNTALWFRLQELAIEDGLELSRP